jgi:pimeloyl-ACP methyl ester carboxylesterase
MIIISSRNDFTDPDRLLPEGHLIKEIDLNDDSEKRDISLETLLDEITGKKICLLVHGYNNEHEEVRDAYEIIEKNLNGVLPGVYDAVIGYSWPGGDSAFEWWSAKRRSNAVGRRFRLLLEQLSSRASIDIISHSLGARVALKALKEASLPLIRHYYCMAAAVDNESLETDQEFNLSLNAVERLFVLHSIRDEVLASAYSTAELDTALGLFGPEDVRQVDQVLTNVFVANCKHVVSTHGAYKRSEQVYQYLAFTQTENPDKFVTLQSA